MTAIGRQFVHPAHDQLPFFAMGRDAVAKQLVGDQVLSFDDRVVAAEELERAFGPGSGSQE